MDLQTYLDNASKVARQKTVGQSDQLTLGELIIKLESIAARVKDEDVDDPRVVFDFEYLYPTGFDSWRGIYAELTLEFAQETREGHPMKLSEFLGMCRETIGKVFCGYKGGDFTMGKTTPIWVANYGNSGNTALVDVVDGGWRVILITGFREV